MKKLTIMASFAVLLALSFILQSFTPQPPKKFDIKGGHFQFTLSSGCVYDLMGNVEYFLNPKSMTRFAGTVELIGASCRHNRKMDMIAYIKTDATGEVIDITYYIPEDRIVETELSDPAIKARFGDELEKLCY